MHIKKIEYQDKRPTLWSNKAIFALNAVDKIVKKFINPNLYILVRPSGKKTFYFLDKRTNKAQAIGVFPQIRYEDAVELSSKMAGETCPQSIQQQNDSFGFFATKFIEKQKTHVSNATYNIQTGFLNNYLLPSLEKVKVKSLKPHVIADLALQIQQKHGPNIAIDFVSYVKRICDIAIIFGVISSNPAPNMRGLLIKKKTVHRSCITNLSMLATYMQKAWTYPNKYLRYALVLAMHLFLRPNELICSKWSDINFDEKILTISAERMKMRRELKKPLSRQVLDILFCLKRICPKDSPWLFPSAKSKSGHIRIESITHAIHGTRMGFARHEMTGHGVRGTASTFLHEFGFSHDLIEAELAHAKDAVVAAYDRSVRIEQRAQMLQVWSDVLEAVQNNKPLPQVDNYMHVEMCIAPSHLR